MQEGPSAKQQIVDRIKNTTNILVTVSSNPSVDELSAALALTLMLNKMDKHGTAVFSGALPPAISFLDPTKTFENTVDSLRDFIIALDKDKADRLRYKVEDDVVRIFITPYRTTITDKDLQFSQGDFNVETIIALGVEKREELDKAIVAHGRILHDAMVVTINSHEDQNSLGAIDWQDPNASSLCEMLVSISESFQQPGLLDQQIATALLTGIVAATDRFSNQHTSPRVMTMSAQLMAAGANQQLISVNLQQSRKEQKQNADGSVQLAPDASTKVEKTPPPAKKKAADGEMHINHEEEKPEPPKQPPANSQQTAEEQLDKQVAAAQPAENFDELKNSIQAETKQQTGPNPQPAPAAQNQSKRQKQPRQQKRQSERQQRPASEAPAEPPSEMHSSWQGRRIEPPTLGGTLSATAEEAHEDALRAEEDERNAKILSHDNPIQQEPVFKDLSNVNPAQAEAPQLPAIAPPESPAPVSAPVPTSAPEPIAPPPAPEPTPEPAPAPAPIEPATNAVADADAARQAIDAAYASQPFDPAHQAMASLGSQEMPQEPSDNPLPPTFETSKQTSALPPLSYETTPQPAPAPAPAPAAEPAPVSPQPFDMPPPPPLPPMPDFNNLPPVPPALPESPVQPAQPIQAPNPTPQQPPAAPDPGQFQIPS